LASSASNRSDGGGEFDSGKAKAYYLETGIQHYTTTRYTPELDGACERMIRTIKGMVSSMLADCKLPTEYWSYAARYAAIVIMKTSKGVSTAWEALTGRNRARRAEVVGSCQGATPTSDKARRPTPTTSDRGRRWRLIGKEGSASKVLSGTYENVAEVGTGRVALSMQRLRQGGILRNDFNDFNDFNLESLRLSLSDL